MFIAINEHTLCRVGCEELKVERESEVLTDSLCLNLECYQFSANQPSDIPHPSLSLSVCLCLSSADLSLLLSHLIYPSIPPSTNSSCHASVYRAISLTIIYCDILRNLALNW